MRGPRNANKQKRSKPALSNLQKGPIPSYPPTLLSSHIVGCGKVPPHPWGCGLQAPSAASLVPQKWTGPLVAGPWPWDQQPLHRVGREFRE